MQKVTYSIKQPDSVNSGQAMTENAQESGELWRAAEDAVDRIVRGSLKAPKEQIERLKKCLEAYRAYEDMDFELKRGMSALLFERYIYLNKLGLLERLGVQNQWIHPLLQEVRDILYEENDEFHLADFKGAQE